MLLQDLSTSGVHCLDQLPPEVELKPLPLLDWTPLEDWRPLFDELLFDEPLFDELLFDPSDELLDELEPEFDVAPVGELELDDDLLPVLVVAAWVEPGSTTATIPATATLARDTDVVVAFSLRLPCSRSATARATGRPAPRLSSPWLAALRLAAPRPDDERPSHGSCTSQLSISMSVTHASVSAVGELSANVLSAGEAQTYGGLPGAMDLQVFSNAQRRRLPCFRHCLFCHGRPPRRA
jgi:hypothetical protein